MNKYDVIVIGAGAAGLMAAGRAAEHGARVLVLEKMKQPGQKLLITGNNRCNITNNKPLGEFISHIYPDGRFLRHAFSQFFSKDILNLLKKYGVETVPENDGRYFPVSNKSTDVLRALLKWIDGLSVEIRCNYKVEKLIIENKIMKGVQANGEKFMAKSIILATGGKSYPATGSTGDGYDLAKQAGHAMEPIRPALVPLVTEGDIAAKLQGLTLNNVKAVIWINGKKEGENTGEMIFTHYGLSGPVILTLSRFVTNALQKNNKAEISLDLKPGLDEQQLDALLQHDLNENGRKKLNNVFRLWVPASMARVLMDLLKSDPDKECHQVTATERRQIKNLLKNLRFGITGHRGFKEAIITAGGISTSGISSKTAESKFVKGLYFAGEIIDLDGETGGYNLQIAWSTGWLAGNSYINQNIMPHLPT